MKTRLLVSLLVIAFAAALIGGATMAWFTDEAQSEPVTFTAGTLMIELDEPNLTKALDTMDMGILNPGDKWSYDFDVRNVGNKSFNWNIYVCWDDVIGQENGDLGADMQQLLIDRGYGTNPLSEVIEWEVFVNGTSTYQGTLPADGGPLVTDMPAFNPSGDPVKFRVTAVLPDEGTTNVFQGAGMQLAVGVNAWQTTNDAPATVEFDCPEFTLNKVVIE